MGWGEWHSSALRYTAGGGMPFPPAVQRTALPSAFRGNFFFFIVCFAMISRRRALLFLWLHHLLFWMSVFWAFLTLSEPSMDAFLYLIGFGFSVLSLMAFQFFYLMRQATRHQYALLRVWAFLPWPFAMAWFFLFSEFYLEVYLYSVGLVWAVLLVVPLGWHMRWWKA